MEWEQHPIKGSLEGNMEGSPLHPNNELGPFFVWAYAGISPQGKYGPMVFTDLNGGEEAAKTFAAAENELAISAGSFLLLERRYLQRDGKLSKFPSAEPGGLGNLFVQVRHSLKDDDRYLVLEFDELGKHLLTRPGDPVREFGKIKELSRYLEKTNAPMAIGAKVIYEYFWHIHM